MVDICPPLHKLYWDARAKYSTFLQEHDPELFRRLLHRAELDLFDRLRPAMAAGRIKREALLSGEAARPNFHTKKAAALLSSPAPIIRC